MPAIATGVSNDNPFSEAQFRTFKYRPEFPKRFGALEHARSVSRDLFAWYNDAHHHSGLSYHANTALVSTYSFTAYPGTSPSSSCTIREGSRWDGRG